MWIKPLGLCGHGKIGQMRWQRLQEMAPFETGKGREECLSKDTERIVTSTKGASKGTKTLAVRSLMPFAFSGTVYFALFWSYTCEISCTFYFWID